MDHLWHGIGRSEGALLTSTGERDRIARMDVIYLMRFAKPCFEVPRRILELGERFYTALSPEYSMDLASLVALPGTSFADTGLEARLQVAVGTRFTLRPWEFEVEMLGVDSTDSLELATRFIASCRDVLDEVVPRAAGDSCRIVARTWLQLQGGAEQATRLLQAHGSSARAALVEQGLHVEANLDLVIYANDRSTESHFRCERSALPHSHLFVLFAWTTRDALATADAKTQALAVETEFRRIASAAGLDLADS
jgi:hypothetical protein